MTPGLFPAEPGRIGSDESGKGDFFGPLVIAAFFLPEGQEGVLRELGVKDSKRTSDARCREIAGALKRRLGRDIDLTTRIDPALVGGIVIRAGDIVIDGSVQGKLRALATHLNR